MDPANNTDISSNNKNDPHQNIAHISDSDINNDDLRDIMVRAMLETVVDNANKELDELYLNYIEKLEILKKETLQKLQGTNE